MNISSEIFPTDGSNFSNDLFYNYTDVENNFSTIPVLFFSLLLVFPINSYVIWLIATGTGNGLGAEFFSLNLAVCEIILCVESVFIFLSHELKILRIIVSVLDGLANGRPVFQCLMCVERYLAVVHPVTFLKYKPLRYRVICSVITWLASFGSSGISIFFFLMSQPMVYFVFLFVHFFLFLSIQLFCCVAVLGALKQSGPGERGREREEENHMKRRAFYLILITTVSMLILYAPYIIVLTLFRSADSADTVFSIIWVCFSLAGLVQPLLILYRVRKLPFVKYH